MNARAALREANDCHLPAGTPQGGQFCSKSGRRGAVPTVDRRSLGDALDEWYWENDEGDYNDIRALPGAEQYPAFFAKLGAAFDTITSLDGKTTVYAVHLKEGTYLVEDGEGRVEDGSEWVNAQNSPEDWISQQDFNEEFWEYPGTVFHATSDENVEDIQKYGIEARNQTRGLTNRGVHSAVFTSTDPERMADSYGGNVFEIDVAAMKRDGYMPTVSMEPAAEEAILRSALAHKVGVTDYDANDYDDPGAADEDTIIFHGSIPAKYLRLMD